MSENNYNSSKSKHNKMLHTLVLAQKPNTIKGQTNLSQFSRKHNKRCPKMVTAQKPNMTKMSENLHTYVFITTTQKANTTNNQTQL